MAYSLQSRTVQEAVAPYMSAVVPSVAVTGDTFAADDGTITDSGTGFVTAKFKAGDVIRVSGSSVVANNKTHIIETVAAGTLTLTSASSLVDDVAGDTWTITPIHKPSRAIISPSDAGIDVTFADGSVANIQLEKGIIYPIAATETNSATVVFLY